MIKALLRIRFLSIIAGITAQGRKRNKSNKGTYLLYGFLFLYVFAVIAGMMAMNFYTLVTPYHQMGLDWLYFAMAGLMCFGICVLGSVFSTQSQLYGSRDNALLLSMPIPPNVILLSRMIPLVLMDLLFGSAVFLPAMVVYAIFAEFSLIGILAQLLAFFAIILLGQTVACLLGWLLHKLLRKLNKTVTTFLFLIVFLGSYFFLMSKAQNLLTALIDQSSMLADTISSFVWPLYAMGLGCAGSFIHALVLPAISILLFGIAYWFLSITFLRTAGGTQASAKKRKLTLKQSAMRTPQQAIITKELRKFLGTPVYFTNMGFGIFMCVAAVAAAAIAREQLMQVFTLMPEFSQYKPMLVCATMAFLISTMSISCPSVSLESSSIWILKSMPVTPQDILKSKLLHHCYWTVPVSAVCTFALGIIVGCSVLDTLLCAVFCGLLALLSGIIGLLLGLKWARLDYISEAYPCKQSIAVPMTMLCIVGLIAVLGLIYFLSREGALSLTVYMLLCLLVPIQLCRNCYRLLMTKGVDMWNAL